MSLRARLLATSRPGTVWNGEAGLAAHLGGKWVAVVAEGTGAEAEQLEIIHCAKGEAHRPFTNPNRPCSGPAWSPDGRRLAFPV